MLNSAEHEIRPANKSQITNNCNSLLLNIAEHENFSADKYEKPAINGIFKFISRESFMLSWIEQKNVL